MRSADLAAVFSERAEEAWVRLCAARRLGPTWGTPEGREAVRRHWERTYNRLAAAARYLRRRARGE